MDFLVSILLLTTSSEKHGTNPSKILHDIPNFIYEQLTGNMNLQRHLLKQHPAEYNTAVIDHQWTYSLSSEQGGAFKHNVNNKHDRAHIPFLPVAFLESLIRFIVTDDQVSLKGLMFFHRLKSSVNSCCGMP
jgi:hypothetical protein